MSTPNLPLLEALRAAAGDRPFVVVTEWLGYLPYGVYSWIEVDGVDITSALPEVKGEDLAGLVAAGLIEEVDHRQTSDDEHDTKTTYRIR